MYKIRTICRACEFGTPSTASGAKAEASPEKLIEVFDLGLQPMANDFCKPDGEHKGYAPLKVMFCPRCSLAQLSAVVDPEILYYNYPYTTSRSQTMLDHFHHLWTSIQVEGKTEAVVEIGSNDGWFLEFCAGHGATSVMGIDPAENLRPADVSGIMTISGLFDAESAQMVKGAMPPVDVIVARHVFAHMDDWRAFLKNLDILAGKDTLIVIECPYVRDLLESASFDTIYHEHLSYISLHSMEHLLRNSPFHLHKFEWFPIHGGAMVVMLRRNDCAITPHRSIQDVLDHERISLPNWQEFAKQARYKIHDLKTFVWEHLENGYQLCGFGASAKSTVWVNACGFTKKHLAYICDSTRLKWGGLSPGSDIPIVDEGALLREMPDMAIMFCWNFEIEVLRTQARYLEKGGKFVVPVPNLRIVGSDGTTKEHTRADQGSFLEKG